VRGDAVRYLQGVIFHKAGGRITIDGYFGPETSRRVRDVQRSFRITVDGVVASDTWPVVDLLAGR
jgi:peptidoglycan hydrolase-like protein with peptidoglycan-binding domain